MMVDTCVDTSPCAHEHIFMLSRDISRLTLDMMGYTFVNTIACIRECVFTLFRDISHRLLANFVIDRRYMC